MEVLVNELSLHKQFNSLNEFIETSLPEFIKIFSFLHEIGNYPLKNYEFYNCSVTQQDTFRSLITNKGIFRISDYVRKYKSILDKIQNEPFWEEHRRHDSQTFYFWNGEIVTDSSIAESFEREASLLSFVPSKYEIERLEIDKEEIANRQIPNFFQFNTILKYFYESREISFCYFCKRFYRNTKISFEYVNEQKSFDLIGDKSDEIQFLNSFNMFCGLSWQDIVSQGGKGENKVGLAYETYHDQQAFKSYKVDYNVDKFRTSGKFRVFGFRKDEKFYVLEFDLSHRLSD
jgi:hypothetical protein